MKKILAFLTILIAFSCSAQNDYAQIGHTRWVACGWFDNLDKIDRIVFESALEINCVPDSCESTVWKFDSTTLNIHFERGCVGHPHTKKILEGNHTWKSDKRMIIVMSKGKQYKFLVLLTGGELMLRRKYEK